MKPDYASLEDMQKWADGVMGSRDPDFIIGDNYLRRWWITPRNAGANVYLHEILKSDKDRALHDHPWKWTTQILRGGYTEITPDGTFERSAGDIIEREATDLHRLIIPEGGRAVTLFITGPKIRDWGFDCPNGWVPWWDFVDPETGTDIGKGCGE